MYSNLENVLKPSAQRDGRGLKLAALMILLLGILAFLFVNSGITWESGKRSILLAGGLAVAYLVAIPLGRFRTRRNIRKSFARFTEAQLRRMDMECGDMTPICGVVVTSHALACEGHLIPISDIVWIYEQNSTQKGIATLNYLIVIDKGKRHHWILLSTKAGPGRRADGKAVGEIVKGLRRHSPEIYYGYSKDIARLYRKDFAGMVAYVEESAAKLRGE